jgi:hypothetical protein
MGHRCCLQPPSSPRVPSTRPPDNQTNQAQSVTNSLHTRLRPCTSSNHKRQADTFSVSASARGIKRIQEPTARPLRALSSRGPIPSLALRLAFLQPVPPPFFRLHSRIQSPGTAPGSRLQAPGSRLQAPGSRLQAPGSRLQAPGFRLQAPSLPRPHPLFLLFFPHPPSCLSLSLPTPAPSLPPSFPPLPSLSSFLPLSLSPVLPPSFSLPPPFLPTSLPLSLSLQPS